MRMALAPVVAALRVGHGVAAQSPPVPAPSTPPAASAASAAPVEHWKPATSNQPGKEHPRVNSERRVKLRIADMSAFKAKNQLVVVSHGSRELGTVRGGDPRANVAALMREGINGHFDVSPDRAHECQAWRRSLRGLAPLLFKHGRRGPRIRQMPNPVWNKRQT